jgi:hypothetical protein
VMGVLIITIPFGLQAFKLASFMLWPFGHAVVRRRDAGAPSVIGNIIWVVLVGWELAIGAPHRRSPADDHDHRDPARPRQPKTHPDLTPFVRPNRRPDRTGPGDRRSLLLTVATDVDLRGRSPHSQVFLEYTALLALRSAGGIEP